MIHHALPKNQNTKKTPSNIYEKPTAKLEQSSKEKKNLRKNIINETPSSTNTSSFINSYRKKKIEKAIYFTCYF